MSGRGRSAGTWYNTGRADYLGKGRTLTVNPDNWAERFLTLADDALVRECDVGHYRASGPGGQKRNKTSSAVRLRHRPTGIAVTAAEDRSQAVNKIRAIRRLRQAIALQLRSTVDPDLYTPSELLATCVGADGELRVARRDHRYWLVVREILDVLAASEMRASDAAKRVGVTTSHLVKFLQKDPKLWERVNQMRAAAGVKPLR